MRVDQVVRDPRRTLQEVLRAFDNNLTARDNFAPEGEVGQVLMSRGSEQKPIYQTLDAEILNLYTKEEINDLIGSHKHDGADITSGQVLPQFLGSGVRDGTRFLRDDGAYDLVPWSSLAGVPTDFRGYGLEDDLAAALAGYSPLGHRHTYESLLGLPAATVGITDETLRLALAPYALKSHSHSYESLYGLPVLGGGGGLTEADVRNMLIGYSKVGHNHAMEEQARELEFILAGQIFGG